MTKKPRRQARDRFYRKNYKELYRLLKASETPGAIRNELAGIFSQLNEVEAIVEMPLKHIRIQQCAEAGLNVPPYLYWLRGQFKESELVKFMDIHPRVSWRNYTEEKYGEPSPQLPVDYGLTLNVLKDRCFPYNQLYHTLVHPFLPLDQSLYSGNIILMNRENYMASLIKGFGTPRSADQPDRETLVFKTKLGAPIPDWAPPSLVDMSEQLRNFMPEKRPITLEVSFYPKPIGTVFWEWRGGSAHDLYTIASRYIEKANSFELVANFGNRNNVLPFPTQPQPMEPPISVPALVLPTTNRTVNLTLVKK